MNNYLKQYLQAVSTLLESGVALDVVLKNTRAVLEKRGHSRLYPALLRSLARTYPVLERKKIPVLTLAKEDDEAKYKKMLSGEEIHKTKIDSSIIGGYVYTKNFVQTDNSYKSKLLTLYKHALSSDRN